MNIKQLQEYPEFIPIVAQWLYDEWIRSMPNGSVSFAEKVLMRSPDIYTHLPLSFVATTEGLPLGIARLTTADMKGREDLSPWLASVYVPPNHRNKGIGKALCNQVVKKAGGLGYNSLYLFTPDRESFYLQQGWKTVEKTKYREKNVHIMKICVSELARSPDRPRR